jgi:DNA gyrase inhibitor GyrI
MKSLQNRYNLIKEGKGNKEIFLKEVRAEFPQYITNVQTFDQVIHSLAEKGIINEAMVLVSANRPETPNWFKIFQENTETVKADLKDTDKSVTEKETAGYNYEDKKNNNNISTQEILNGYYAEMKDPKNADKTENEIKAIVFKNLEKDPLFYIKNAAFGVKGIGYTQDAPGLGPTKEVTGKYKSSGMEPVKLNESLTEGYGDSLEDAMKRAYEGSLEGYVQHVEDKGDGTYTVSDWYDDETTVVSFEDGRKFNDRTNQAQSDYMKRRSDSSENLSEAKKRAIDKHIAEIEKMGEVAAWDHRINKTQEKIDELTNKMTVTEGDDVKDMVDKKAVKELKKDIAVLSKKKALYEKQKAKAAKRVKDKSVMQTAAGEGTTVMEKEEKPFIPPADPIRDRIKASMVRDTAPKPKKESWSGMVRELINKKNLKVK